MSHKRKVLQGSASNIVRLVLSMLVSFVLPPFLVHRLPPAEYSAWVLILNLSSYVNLLDFGLQTAIGKFVAEYDARGEREASRRLVSTSFTILSGIAVVACAAVAVGAWAVPRLFHQMPLWLVPEMRVALLAVGISTAAGLPFNVFLSTFVGLQQYLFPTVLATFTRVASAAVLITLLLLHGGLMSMALVMAAFNLIAAIAAYLGWRRLVRARVDFAFMSFDRQSAVRLAKFGSVISIWTLAGLFISGLDLVIVGHYRYQSTGFYSVANGAVGFMLGIVSSIFGPLVPAVSSAQSDITPSRFGELCIRITRYCVLLLCLLGLPLYFGAYPLLSLWVGKHYAGQSALFLEVLVAGNCIRQIGLTYTLFVVATGKQHLATIAAVVEATVNLSLSIWLVQRVGAVGVAIGTLVGAFVSVAMHVTVSMRLTQSAIQFQRSRFMLQGLFRPMLVLMPSLLLYGFWRKLSMLPAPPAVLAAWALLTLAIAWGVALTAADRKELGALPRRLLYWRAERA